MTKDSVKVGQIYYSNLYKRKCVVSWVSADKERVHFICTDGFMIESRCMCFEDLELILEYPTWQEAVNSKEFNQ